MNIFMKAAMDEFFYGMCDGQMFFRVGVTEKVLWKVLWKFPYGRCGKNISVEGATERAIATTTVTNGAAKPSSGETTRPLDISSH